MRGLRAAWLRLFASIAPARSDNDLSAELESHLNLHVDEQVRLGMPREEARRQALLKMGGVELTRERVRDQRGVPMIDALRLDLKYAFRRLRSTPAFTLIVVLTLALGSGANAAIFSIFNQALVRLLPVPAPEQLVNLSSPGPKTGRTSTSSTFGPEAVFSYPLFRDIERAQPVFTGIAAHRDFVAHVAYKDRASTEAGLLVSGSYFPVLAARPALGRLLTPDDDRAVGAHRVVVLSHGYWRSNLNANPAVLNDNLVVNGQPMTIVGVAPADFMGTTLENRPMLFVPVTMAGLMMPGLRNPHSDGGPWSGFEDRRDHWLYLFARLKPGMSREAAEQAINVPFTTIIRDIEFPAQRGGMGDAARERFRNRRLFLESGPQGQRPERAELSGVFLLLFCVTGIVLLISCANIANLMLARAAARERDVTVRLSLGAARRRLVFQMLTESFLLAVVGSAGGLFVARWTLSGLSSLIPAAQGSAMFGFEIDATVLLFGIALSVAMPLLFGLYPALLTTRRDLSTALRGGTAGTRSAVRFRTTLAAAQIALSMALIVVAVLFSKSLLNLSRVELGMRVANVTTFRASPELNGYSPARSQLFFDRIEEALSALPGVTSVSTSTIPVLAGIGGGSNVTVEGFKPGPDENTSASSSAIGPGYFRTLGIPLPPCQDK